MCGIHFNVFHDPRCTRWKYLWCYKWNPTRLWHYTAESTYIFIRIARNKCAIKCEAYLIVKCIEIRSSTFFTAVCKISDDFNLDNLIYLLVSLKVYVSGRKGLSKSSYCLMHYLTSFRSSRKNIMQFCRYITY